MQKPTGNQYNLLHQLHSNQIPFSTMPLQAFKGVSSAVYQVFDLILCFLTGRCINYPNNQNVRFTPVILHFQCKGSCLSHHKYLLVALVEINFICLCFFFFVELSPSRRSTSLPALQANSQLPLGQPKRDQRHVLSTLLYASLSVSCQQHARQKSGVVRISVSLIFTQNWQKQLVPVESAHIYLRSRIWGSYKAILPKIILPKGTREFSCCLCHCSFQALFYVPSFVSMVDALELKPM